MEQKFEFEEHSPAPDIVREDELLPLIDRLYEQQFKSELEVDHTVTVDSVVEATGMSVNDVVAALTALREERLSRVLRELEEPLFRVERASPNNADPLSSAPPLARLNTRRTILDDLPRVDVVVLNRTEKSKQSQTDERKAWAHSTIFLYVLVIAMLLAVIVPMVKR